MILEGTIDHEIAMTIGEGPGEMIEIGMPMMTNVAHLAGKMAGPRRTTKMKSPARENLTRMIHPVSLLPGSTQFTTQVAILRIIQHPIERSQLRSERCTTRL